MNQSIRIIYLLIFLISGVLVTQAQVTLPEQVCVGCTQRYWVEGLPGSVYTWRVNGVVQGSTSNEINIQWTNVWVVDAVRSKDADRSSFEHPCYALIRLPVLRIKGDALNELTDLNRSASIDLTALRNNRQKISAVVFSCQIIS